MCLIALIAERESGFDSMKTARLILTGLLLLFVLPVQFGNCVALGASTAQRELPKTQYNNKLGQARINAAASIFRFYNRTLSEGIAQEYASFVMDAARRYSVDPGLIAGIIIKESTVKANARTRYAVGLMQVYWKLHQKSITEEFPHITTEKALIEPRNNIMVGTWLFTQYLTDCGGNVTKALYRYLGAQASRYAKQIKKYREQFAELVRLNLRQPANRSG